MINDNFLLKKGFNVFPEMQRWATKSLISSIFQFKDSFKDSFVQVHFSDTAH